MNALRIFIAFVAHLFLAGSPLLAERTNILFLAGSRSHASGDHEFRAGCLLLAKALNEESGLDVEAVVVSGWPEEEEVFEGVDAVIVYSDATKVVQHGWETMDELARSGVGLMFMHYAVHPNAENGETYFRPWIGGAFETGFSVNPHWVADLKPLPGHPVSRGVDGKTTTALDEFYYNMRFIEEREKILPLVTGIPSQENIKRIINLWTQEGYEGIGTPQPVMWGIERSDGGRGIGYTGGHYHRNWAIDGVRQMVLNAIVWVSGMEVPENGVSSLPVTEERLNQNLDRYDTPNPWIELPSTEEVRALPPNPWFTVKEHARAEAERKAARKRAREEAKK
ncbi:MAG: ThuA domain-containing protein [Verrucomicrobiota bacterium]